jgi:phage-related protein
MTNGFHCHFDVGVLPHMFAKKTQKDPDVSATRVRKKTML